MLIWTPACSPCWPRMTPTAAGPASSSSSRGPCRQEAGEGPLGCRRQQEVHDPIPVYLQLPADCMPQWELQLHCCACDAAWRGADSAATGAKEQLLLVLAGC